MQRIFAIVQVLSRAKQTINGSKSQKSHCNLNKLNANLSKDGFN